MNQDREGPPISTKIGNDWCHLCGVRGEMAFVEFRVPENAEHSLADGARGYFRFCNCCVAAFRDKLDDEHQSWERDNR